MKRLKGIVYDLITWLATLPGRKKANRKVLIVRIDEIGDYMLWRNFLNEITASAAFRNQQIYLCGNKSWRSIYEAFDTKSAVKTIWLDKMQFKKNMGYRYRLLKAIYQHGFDTVINPTFSRDKRYDDAIVKAAVAKRRFGMVANKESVLPYEIGYDRKLYTRLFELPEKPVFEFYRNRFFTESITGIPSAVTDTRVPDAMLPVYPDLPHNYFVIFPGSRSKKRIWPVPHFIETGRHLFEQHGLTAVVCGAMADKEYTDAFCNQYPHPVLDLTGKTSLPEMLRVLKEAKLLVSVDTGSVHLAAAVGCAVFGIFNGSQYKRFAPYPPEIHPAFYAIYPDAVETELSDPELVLANYEFVVDIPYESVPASKVIAAIDTYFASKTS